MHVRLSKNNRVLALIALMAAASFAVGGLVAVVTASEADALSIATRRLAEVRVVAADVTADLGDEQAALDDYVLSGNLLAKLRFDAAVTRDVEAFAKLDTLMDGLPSVAAAIDVLEREAITWRDDIAAPALLAATARDEAALREFGADAVGDQDDIAAANDAVIGALSIAEADIANRSLSVDGITNVGITVAFGFLLLAFAVALIVVRRFGKALERDALQSSILNLFTEVTSFAADDREVAVTALTALDRLASPDASVVHILNRSMDRAVPEAHTGEAIAEVLPLHALARCAGVLRGTIYVTDDLSDDLTVRCPIYPAAGGTLACVPLTSGESVGAVHLYWKKSQALPLELRSSIARITEHAALAIGNRRLLVALHGQANTDARTGLTNSRAFDLALEQALTARANHQSLAVLMIDVDHFKQFNDRHGHPAGDVALKAFAGVLRSCMRDGDIAARYGGEEFAVFLPGIASAAATSIAERIRARTEGTLISLAPGQTDRITISIGVASVPGDAEDRVSLLRLADEALYQAKEAGRNQVRAIAAGAPSTASDALEAGLPEPTRLRRARRAAGGGAAAPRPIDA